MSATRTVTVAVPVYCGELFIEETLHSLQKQTHRDIEVIISLDGADPLAEALLDPFLQDSRFRLVVQPQRLGWVDNLNWLMTQVETPYWCYLPQDDLLDPRYVELLIAHADDSPEAAVVYCDIQAFGLLDTTFVQPSVTGSGGARQLALLYEHLAAVAFRGLTRVEALRVAGDIPANEIENFACDTAWMAAIARWGELQRVPLPLYRKRYHPGNEHTKWAQWPVEKRTRAWTIHCAAMLEQAMLVETTAQERRLLWLAAVGRLVSPRTAPHYVPVSDLTSAERVSLLDTFLELVRARGAADIPELLEAGWDEIEQWTRGFYERS
jgi:hypothetical protein